MNLSWLSSWWIKLLILLGLLVGGYHGVQVWMGSGNEGFVEPSSTSTRPSLTDVPPGDINCDCPHVDAGLLTPEYREQCETNEAQLRQKAIDGNFRLKADANGVLVEGDFCDTVTAGPNPWPVQGSTVIPPPRTDFDEEPCDEPSGLTRGC